MMMLLLRPPAAAEFTVMVAYTRAREADTPVPRSVSRPTRAIWLSRLGGPAALGDVAISFSRNPFAAMMMMRPPRRRRRTMELGRWTAISYGVIDNRSENLQH